MTKFTLFVVLFLFLLRATPAMAHGSLDLTEHAMQQHALAPADSYVGLYRMSVLGIRSTIHDLSALIDTAPSTNLTTLYHKLTMVEDAVLDLQNHYPGDSWLPRFGLGIAQAFVRFPFSDAQVRASDTSDWVIADYPTSAQASYAFRVIRARMQPTVTGRAWVADLRRPADRTRTFNQHQGQIVKSTNRHGYLLRRHAVAYRRFESP